MSDTPDTIPQSAASKYKTIARAVVANDVAACEEIYQLLADQNKTLTSDDVNALGLRWFNNKEQPNDMADFFHKLKFNFEQVVILDQKTENVGTRIPFRLIGYDKGEALLTHLLSIGAVSKDVSDGMGDNLISQALEVGRFEFATTLKNIGVDIDQTNMSGQSALHLFAGKLGYQAVQWLGQNGADPTLEDLQGARPSELVPEVMDGWDANAMFDVLEEYVTQFQSGQGFEINGEFNAMIEKEKPKEEGSDQTLGEQADEAKALLGSLTGGP